MAGLVSPRLAHSPSSFPVSSYFREEPLVPLLCQIQGTRRPIFLSGRRCAAVLTTCVSEQRW